MEARISLSRGESTWQCCDRKAPVDRKAKVRKTLAPVLELLAKLSSLKLQTIDFLIREKDLCGTGLNPKLSSDMAIVTAENIEEVSLEKMFPVQNHKHDPQSKEKERVITTVLQDLSKGRSYKQ